MPMISNMRVTGNHSEFRIDQTQTLESKLKYNNFFQWLFRGVLEIDSNIQHHLQRVHFLPFHHLTPLSVHCPHSLIIAINQCIKQAIYFNF